MLDDTGHMEGKWTDATPDSAEVACALVERERRSPMGRASLLEAARRAGEQLELVPSEELDGAAAAGLAGLEEGAARAFTAGRLFRKNPQIYRAILTLTAEGLPLRHIARALGVSHNTIAAVCEREGAALGLEREAVVARYRGVERMLLERLMEVGVEAMRPEALAMALGIVRDKINLMEGAATARVEVVEAGVSISAINSFVDTLARGLRKVEGRVVETEGVDEPAQGLQTGMGERRDFAMAAAAAAGRGDEDGREGEEAGDTGAAPGEGMGGGR